MEITYTAMGNIATAENTQFSWFYGQPDYVTEIATGRSIYLPVGGYAKSSGLGCDPAPDEVVSAARAFVVRISTTEKGAADLAAKQNAEKMDDAMAVLKAIPESATNELASINTEMAHRAAMVNEGGEGYVPQLTWGSAAGREIAARHGVDIDAVLTALNTLSR